MRLRPLFVLLSSLLLLTVLAMTVGVMAGAWRDLRHSDAGLDAIEQLKSVLLVAEMASRERGPANGVLGADLPIDPLKWDRLRQARHKTDTAFEALQQVLDQAQDAHDSVVWTTQRAQEQLALARQAIDATAQQPRVARSADEIRGVVGQMISVVDTLAPAAVWLNNHAAASFPSAASALMAARQAASLREYAGQLGSQFTAPLTTRQPLSEDERQAIERLRGRIEQLRQQLAVLAAVGEMRPPVQAAIDRMQGRYFGAALAFVDAQTAIGLKDGRFEVSTAEFAARYVPDMDAILNLRDVLLDEALADARRGVADARWAAQWAAGGALLTLALLGVSGWLLHRRVVHPLGTTTQLIVTIARGQLDVEVPTPLHQDEVADMLGAIKVLRDNSLARQAAEAAIRQMAYYDRLTGLPNRRLLEDRMHQVLARAQRHKARVAVLFIDLDEFKPVNDQHGHETGDWLLGQAAQRMRSALRESDTAARVGGDEFVVLLPDAPGLPEAVLVAEKIRQQLAQPFVTAAGLSLQISCSIGVALYPDQADNARDLMHCGDEAMYKAKTQGRNAVAVFAPEPARAASG